ncbi:MAG: 2-dehydro-3-deoxyphosphogluconate aldolase/4-hydroxy-2-oxoglutarate aldolase [Gemmatimonadetes bacterium]|jgi:2-dehydro-3-deoxyphosphogluconate aldolase/(4S)-4-hydroxy-2-oxoglutarate aldolase|nr:2-dehydro-3-deoxyphosphogluconate aldolase/4-hydroxy-2-oxoglutarate aldolase [Gemmatimonadota bacterium]
MSASSVAARLRALRVVPVIVIDDPAAAVPLANALAEGGLPCAEVTFRTAGAVEALTRIARERPDFLLGAGTVLTPGQADRARDAGAAFAVAPGLNRRVVEHCLKIGLPFYPGVATPSELEAALEMGLRTVKLFPAEQLGGVPYLKAITSPFGEVDVMPSGGISRETLGGYLAVKRVVACGGSWMAPSEWIAAGSFDRIRDETRRAVELAGSAAAVPVPA